MIQWLPIIALTEPATHLPAWEIVNRVTAIVTLIGFPLALLGLALSFKEARQAKTASEAARMAVQRFRQDLNLINNVADFTRALSIMDEIKRLLRGKAFVPLPDRLAEMRKLLISIRQNTSGLSEEEQGVFQNAIVNFQILEKHLDSCILKQTEPKDIASINQGVSLDTDSLQEILGRLRNEIGEPPQHED